MPVTSVTTITDLQSVLTFHAEQKDSSEDFISGVKDGNLLVAHKKSSATNSAQKENTESPDDIPVSLSFNQYRAIIAAPITGLSSGGDILLRYNDQEMTVDAFLVAIDDQDQGHERTLDFEKIFANSDGVAVNTHRKCIQIKPEESTLQVQGNEKNFII